MVNENWLELMTGPASLEMLHLSVLTNLEHFLDAPSTVFGLEAIRYSLSSKSTMLSTLHSSAALTIFLT